DRPSGTEYCSAPARSVVTKPGSGGMFSWRDEELPPRVRTNLGKPADKRFGKDERPQLTQNQLQELLESEQARVMLEGAEERGYVLPAELEVFALEHDLADEEVEALTRELEAIGLEVGQPAADEPEAATPA